MNGDHGGDVLRTADQLGLAVAEILDFSASLNPLGIPPEVLRAAQEALPLAAHYPEIDGASLAEELAAHHGLPQVNLLPGSGSTELLYLLPRVLRPRRALVVTPAFSEYRRSLLLAGAAVDTFDLDVELNFRLDPAALLARLEPETDLVLLANPGNPTGTAYAPELLLDLVRSVPPGVALAVDEAFVDFCPQHSIVSWVTEFSNLYVFRSLTKFYAIPGLRAGFLAGPAGGIARLQAAKEPWTLSTPSLAAARACLVQDAYRETTLQQIPLLRRQLAEGLEQRGFQTFPSAANFLLARLPDGAPVAPLLAALRRRGILLRDASTFVPLDQGYLRLAVRTAEEHQRLFHALDAL